jgi:hypothetical protein
MGRRVARRRLVPIGYQDGHAVPRELLSDRGADAHRGAGYECDLFVGTR